MNRRRDLDYLVQTNFLAFLVLWRSERYEQAQKYISLCKKFMNEMIDTSGDVLGLADGAESQPLLGMNLDLGNI